MLTTRTTLLAAFCFASAGLSAQQPPAPAGNRGPAGPATPARRRPVVEFDADAVKRGQEVLVARCGFCHGSNGRGGASGPDLTRSTLVQEDENGRELGAFLKVGRPERSMPKFELSDQEVGDLATFLHSAIHLAANRGLYQLLDIVVGDPKAGAKFFGGAGRCVSCHSAEGDLKGVGAKYEPATLQGRILMPRGGRFFGPPGGPGGPGGRGGPSSDATAVKATVTLPSGESHTGALLRLTDFDVSILDPATERRSSWLRKDGVPAVTLVDPLQAHVDMWAKWTDDDLHNVTAYLTGLK